MQAEYLILYDSCQRQIVKEICQVFPHVGVAILAEALVVETVDLSDLATLVIASQNRDSVLKAHFQTDQERHCLDTVVAAIDIIAHEQVVCIRRASSNLKQFHQVVELAVDITADRDRALDRLNVYLGL